MKELKKISNLAVMTENNFLRRCYTLQTGIREARMVLIPGNSNS
jgi:hypothetical protein